MGDVVGGERGGGREDGTRIKRLRRVEAGANASARLPMPVLSLRPSHKAVAAYYESLAAFKTLGTEHELAVKSAFATLLETAAKPFGWKLVPE